MLDIRWIRDNADVFNQAMCNRGSKIRAESLLLLDDKRKKATAEIQELQQRRNSLAKEIADLRKAGLDSIDSMHQSKIINNKLKELEEKFTVDSELNDALLSVPNVPEESVPVGNDEHDNFEVERWGEIRKFNFEPKQHFEIGENLGMLDFEQSSRISGARFSTLSGDLAKLERALANFMLDVAGEYGYKEFSPPNLVQDFAMQGSGQLPKFAAEAFRTENGYWLIPTAEVPLVNWVAQKIIDEKDLPLRFTAYTPCFRSEAGAAGKDTRGMIRQHQFKKVELVAITTQEESAKEHEMMTAVAMEVLKRLNLPFRRILLCTGDMGFCSQKTYDLEVWLPGQNKYREISSCSNCGDFQARRMDAKYRHKDSKKSLYLHTLNGSSLAVGRTIVAILENYQNHDGSVEVPQVLFGYMGGTSVIRS